MKWNTTQKVALAISLGIFAVAITLRFMGAARPILMLLHLTAAAACGFALLARRKPGPPP
jgi:hypothetical protein